MRLFIALETPPEWAAAARALQQAFPADLRHVLRLVDPALMHLTLRFLGEVPEPTAAVLDAALAERIVEPRARLSLGRTGTFGPPQRTQVVYLGIAGNLDGLASLAGRVEGAVAEAGLPPERRAFAPHLTLARVQRQATAPERRAVAQAAADLEAPPGHEFEAREVVLVRSILGGRQPRYEALSRYG